MVIKLKRVNNDVLFEAKNESDNTILIDGSAAVGGVDGGFRPMELLLAGIGGCSIIDIISILKKQRQQIEDVTIDVQGTREKEGTTSIFKNINLHYTLSGTIERQKAQKAIELGLYKYCSVGKMLEKDAEITFTFEIK